MRFLKLLVCLFLVAAVVSCEKRKTREEIEADFKDIDRTELPEEEIMDYEEQHTHLNEDTEAFKKKKLLEEEEQKKQEAEEKAKQERKKAEQLTAGEDYADAQDNTDAENHGEQVTGALDEPVEQPATAPVQKTGSDVIVDGLAQ